VRVIRRGEWVIRRGEWVIRQGGWRFQWAKNSKKGQKGVFDCQVLK
jgi:hypothetical protein